ncbi:MAG: hypothetical protein IJI53_00825 [Clostridia bacterium]|nr:hypothetical protein [Clostridia bacterium]
MNELLETIADDLRISQYQMESESDFCYRVCYSALAFWLLTSAKGKENEIPGISKKAQTDTILKLLELYNREIGLESQRFFDDNYTYCQHIRDVYEETGYLFTDNRNYSMIANFGRAVKIDEEYLYFGCPDNILSMRGLGVYSENSVYTVTLYDAMIRDNLSIREYILSQYNPLDFEERDIDLNTLEFFNPRLRKNPSSSWEKQISVKNTVARTRDKAQYFRVMSSDEGVLTFADCRLNEKREKLNAFEQRRLYIALKAYYNEPVIAWISPLDSAYTEIRLSAHLPNREYYFLLLLAWPMDNAFQKNRFVTTIGMLPVIETMLKNLGIEVRRRRNV